MRAFQPSALDTVTMVEVQFDHEGPTRRFICSDIQ